MTVYKSGLKVWPVGPTIGAAFSIDGDKGANIWTDITVLNGASVTVKLQQCSPKGTWLDVAGAISGVISTLGGGVMKIYPGVTPVANQVVNNILGGGAYRIVATVSAGSPTAEVTVESIA